MKYSNHGFYTTIKEGEKVSPAYQLMDHAWQHACCATARNNRTMDSAMYNALRYCITHGFKFDLDDCKRMSENFGRFVHVSSEGNYRLAVDVKNISACRSIETAKNRPPYLLDGKRLAENSDFWMLTDPTRDDWWEDMENGHRSRWKRIWVTSFGDEQFVACWYDNPDQHRRGENRNPSKVFKITREDWKAKISGGLAFWNTTQVSEYYKQMISPLLKITERQLEKAELDRVDIFATVDAENKTVTLSSRESEGAMKHEHNWRDDGLEVDLSKIIPDARAHQFKVVLPPAADLD